MDIYFQKYAKSLLELTLSNRNIKKCKGCFKENGIWIAFDNTTNNCWVEEFDNLNYAICWLDGLFEMSEIMNFNVFSISKYLHFIPKIGYLNIRTKKDILKTTYYPA